MNYVPNKTGKVLEETLACFNSGHVKATLRHLCCFKIALPILHVLQNSRPKQIVLGIVLKVNVPHSS